ncbi:MAG: sugar phosphate isomerase/epimerase [Thermoflexibacter sp.]|nr:sugar phosphate isomerase/epimerase [Thermoflexibacter sp.]
MRLGISSFTYGWAIGVEGNMPSLPMTELDLIQQTLHFGLSCLQIGDNLPLHTFSQERLNHLKKQLADNQIRIEVGARRMTAEHLMTYIEIARFLNASLLRFVIDGENYEPDSEEIISIIRRILPLLTQYQITLGIENHDRLRAKELASIVKKIDSDKVGICLDCVNSMGAGEGLEYVAEILAPYTVNLHIKDFIVRRLPHKMGFTVEGVPAGKGMIQLDFLLEKIKAFQRCKSAILEQWVVPDKDIDSTVKKEKIWAEESIQYLQTISYSWDEC